MTPRVPLPLSKLKKQRRARRIRIAVVLATLLLLIAGVAVGSTWIPFIRANAVTVTGAETIATSTIEQFVQEKIAGRKFFIIPNNNIFLYPKQKITRELLATYPQLMSVEVHADTFHTIGVVATERHPVALWCGTNAESGSPCYLMDANGLAYVLAANFSGDAYYTYYGHASSTAPSGVPNQYLTPEQFRSLSALVVALAANLKKNTVDHITADESGDVRISFSGGFDVLFVLTAAPGVVHENFVLALDSDPFLKHPVSDFEYLDLRFGDKLYYHLR